MSCAPPWSCWVITCRTRILRVLTPDPVAGGACCRPLSIVDVMVGRLSSAQELVDEGSPVRGVAAQREGRGLPAEPDERVGRGGAVGRADLEVADQPLEGLTRGQLDQTWLSPARRLEEDQRGHVVRLAGDLTAEQRRRG